VAKGFIILSHFPQEKGISSAKTVQEEQVDFSRPWTFFDGASQTTTNNVGRGEVIHLSNNHLFKLQMGLGPVTNNYA
jgi:hypothetical protein